MLRAAYEDILLHPSMIWYSFRLTWESKSVPSNLKSSILPLDQNANFNFKQKSHDHRDLILIKCENGVNSVNGVYGVYGVNGAST